MKLFKKWHEKKKMNKYRGYNPASNPDELGQFVHWIKTYSTIDVKNIMEIGANFAQDADFLREKFDVPPQNVWVFEAHPEIYSAIKKIHPKFKAFNYAIFNQEKEMVFNIYPLAECARNTGCSSLFELTKESLSANFGSGRVTIKTRPYRVQSLRMDNFMNTHGIDSVDFLKLDAEGVNYEVLLGFGDRLKDVQCLHVESEQYDDLVWVGQKENWTHIHNLLIESEFELVYFQKYYSMADSFWVKSDQIKRMY